MDGESAVLDFTGMETPSLESAPPVETPETPPETPAGGTPAETLETPETPAGETPEKPEGTKPGAPPSLKALRDAVKAFGEASPEHAAAIKNMLNDAMRYKAFTEAFPDVDTARSVKAAIEAAGGLEGIGKLSELQRFVDDINTQWDNGDPAALDYIFEDGGDGPVKLLPHYMNRVEKQSPEAFGNAVRPHLVRSLEASNFDGALAALARLVADKPEAKEIVDSIAAWKNEQKRLSEKTNLDSLEPERKKLTEQATELSKREFKQFEYEVTQDVKPALHQAFAERMRTYLQHDTRPDAAKQDIARKWVEELGKALEKDQKQIDSMMKAKGRNKAAIANFIKTRISAVADGVTAKIVSSYKLTPGKPGAAKPAGGDKGVEAPQTGAGSISSPIRVKEKPADAQIDWDADPDRMHFISGKAKLLNGSKQWVKWR